MSDLDLEMLRRMQGEPARAADEVERLRAEKEQLKAVLRFLEQHIHDFPDLLKGDQ